MPLRALLHIAHTHQPCPCWPAQLPLGQLLLTQLGYLLLTNPTARNQLGRIQNRSPGDGATFAQSRSRLLEEAHPEMPQALKLSRAQLEAFTQVLSWSLLQEGKRD